MYDKLLLLDQQICFKLYKTSRNVTRLYQPFLSKFNLTYPQYIVMLAMFEHEVIDFKELSSIIELKTGTLTPIIQKLEKIGYIIKIKNPNDKRKINIKITDKGRILKKNIITVPLDVYKLLPIKKENYKALVDELNIITKLINQSENLTQENDE